jgi:hypothetical protein
MAAVGIGSLSGDKSLLERAYAVLSFLAHAFVYGEEPLPKVQSSRCADRERAVKVL